MNARAIVARKEGEDGKIRTKRDCGHTQKKRKTIIGADERIEERKGEVAKKEEEKEGSEKYADEREKSSSGAFCGNATAEEDGKTWGRRRRKG